MRTRNEESLRVERKTTSQSACWRAWAKKPAPTESSFVPHGVQVLRGCTTERAGQVAVRQKRVASATWWVSGGKTVGRPARCARAGGGPPHLDHEKAQ
jgi:hypothetical protein